MNACDGEATFACPNARRMSLTFDCIRDAVTNLYRVDDFALEELGTGFFSRVYKVQHRTTGEVMVLKLNKNASNRQQALKEVQLMKRLSHPNILRFLGVCVHEGQLHPLTEFINGGNLEELLLDRKQALSWTIRLGLARDIARGMGYLHSRGVIHRDLTSKNCLIKRLSGGKLSAVVADFGLAAKLPRMSLTPDGRHVLSVVGTAYFSAPEVLRGERYDEMADVFSFGIILCQVIARIIADPEELPRTNSFGVDEVSLTKKCVDCPSVLWNLAMDCCQLDPLERPDFLAAEQRLGVSLLMPCPDTPPLPSEFHPSRVFGLFSSPRQDNHLSTAHSAVSIRRSASLNHHHQRSFRSKSVERTHSLYSTDRQPALHSSFFLQSSRQRLPWSSGVSNKGESSNESCVSSVPLSSSTDPVPLIRDAVDEVCSAMSCAVDEEGFLTARPSHMGIPNSDSIVRPNSTPPVICHTTDTLCIPQCDDVMSFDEELVVKVERDETMGETIPSTLLPQCNGFASESPTLTPPPTPGEGTSLPSDVFLTVGPGRGPSPKMHRKCAAPVRDTVMYPYSIHSSPRVRRKALAAMRGGPSSHDRLHLDLDILTGDASPTKSISQLSSDAGDSKLGSAPNVYTTCIDRGVNRRHYRNATISGCITSELTRSSGMNGFVWQTSSAPSSPSAVPHRNMFVFQNPGSEGRVVEPNSSQLSVAAGQSR